MRHGVSVLLAAMAAMPAAQGRSQIDPRSDPELIGESVAQRGAELLGESAAAAAVAMPAESARFDPARPHRPGDASTTDDPGRLLPDGSFLVDQLGEVRASPTGAWIFLPSSKRDAERASEPSTPQIRPMIVLPSQILGRLQRVVGQDNDTAEVRLTGRVTLFHKQNYLLITAIGAQDTTQQADTPAAAAPVDEPAATQDDQPSTEDGLSGAVQSLIEDLESERTGVRAVISGLGAGDESSLAPIAEGRMISRRRGRFVRLDAGELAMTFDNDQTDTLSIASDDVPLVIAPCALLEAVEATLETHGDAMTATVSGQTLAFAGRSFLLPISIVIERPGELESRQ